MRVIPAMLFESAGKRALPRLQGSRVATCQLRVAEVYQREHGLVAKTSQAYQLSRILALAEVQPCFQDSKRLLGCRFGHSVVAGFQCRPRPDTVCARKIL